jgi:hypothetical protein
MDFSQYFYGNARLLLETGKNSFLHHFSSTSHNHTSVLIHQDMTSRNISVLNGTVYIMAWRVLSLLVGIQKYRVDSSIILCHHFLFAVSLFFVIIFCLLCCFCLFFLPCYYFVSSQKGRTFRDYLSIH